MISPISEDDGLKSKLCILLENNLLENVKYGQSIIWHPVSKK